jgi:talin
LLIFKKTSRALKIRLMDETIKTVMINDALTVAEITDVVGQRLNLGSNSEEYSLARGDGTAAWLHPTQTLQEQGIEEKDVLYVSLQGPQWARHN